MAGSDAWSTLESLGAEPPATPASPEPGTPAPPAKPDLYRGPDGKFVKPTEAPKPGEKPTEPAATPPEKMAPKQLRDAYEALKAKHAALETERNQMAAKLAEPPKEDPEKKSLAERLTAREKRLAEIEDELKFSAFERSQEYKDRYEKPFVDAYLLGRAKTAALSVATEEGKRAGTAEDFDTLMKIADDEEAAEWAAQTFGAKAPMVLFHRERVQELNQARNQAVQDYRKNGSEREKAKQQQLEDFRKNFTAAVEQRRKESAEKYPHFFKPDPNDPKSQEYLDRGQALVDRVIANGAPVKDGDTQMNPAELADAVAAIRNKAAAFDRVAHDLFAARKTIKDLQAKLDGFQQSVPGPGQGGKAGIPGQAADNLKGALAQMEADYSSG